MHISEIEMTKLRMHGFNICARRRRNVIIDDNDFEADLGINLLVRN